MTCPTHGENCPGHLHWEAWGNPVDPSGPPVHLVVDADGVHPTRHWVPVVRPPVMESLPYTYSHEELEDALQSSYSQPLIISPREYRWMRDNGHLDGLMGEHVIPAEPITNYTYARKAGKSMQSIPQTCEESEASLSESIPTKRTFQATVEGVMVKPLKMFPDPAPERYSDMTAAARKRARDKNTAASKARKRGRK